VVIQKSEECINMVSQLETWRIQVATQQASRLEIQRSTGSYHLTLANLKTDAHPHPAIMSV
jgi:hypothetical protein